MAHFIEKVVIFILMSTIYTNLIVNTQDKANLIHTRGECLLKKKKISHPLSIYILWKRPLERVSFNSFCLISPEDKRSACYI